MTNENHAEDTRVGTLSDHLNTLGTCEFIKWDAIRPALVEAAIEIELLQDREKRLRENLNAAWSEFKNFHRILCERFDYTHDEKDWRRDQISLVEWIYRNSYHTPLGVPTFRVDSRGLVTEAKDGPYVLASDYRALQSKMEGR